MKFAAGEVNKIDDLIIEFTFDKDVEIDQQMSIEILSAIMSLSDGKPHALLYNFKEQNIILSEIARKFSGARNYRNSNLVARAIVTQSLSSSLEANHYINKTSPSADTVIFKSRAEAVAWLHEKAKTFVASTDASSESEL
jgi:hypothetical protein